MTLHQPDLFTYPRFPGAKTGGTSKRAAEKIAPRAPTLKQRVLALLRTHALTADECAAVLNVTVLACRPRLSELVAMDLIEDTGRTRRNESGIAATIWRAR